MDANEVNLYRMNDADVVAAATLAEAVEFYKREFGLSDAEAFTGDPPFEIDIDEETRIATDVEGLPAIPAREAMADDLLRGCKPPYLFSSTEW